MAPILSSAGVQERGSEIQPHTRRQTRRHRNRRLAFAIVFLLVPIAAGIATVEYVDSFPSEEAEQPEPTERSQPESLVSSETARSMDETWAAAVAQDASPSLAVPGETIAFGHRIALTFDDGPDPATTPAILDVLRDYHVKGTFFVIGARAEQHPELIDRIVSEGHTLGNHTYYHRDLTKLTPELVSRELQDTQAVIDEVLGEHSQITLFRPPCGAPYITQMEGLPVFQEAMREQRLYPVMWTIDSRDWALENQPESIVDNLAQSTPEGGGVVLLHDTQPQTVEALPKVIEWYSAAGLKFTGVRDLLAEKYGVDPNGIEADPDATRPSTPLQPEVSDNNRLSDLNSLAECLS